MYTLENNSLSHTQPYVIVLNAGVTTCSPSQCVCVCVLQRELKLEGHDNELEQERLRGSNIVYGEKVQVHSLPQTAGRVHGPAHFKQCMLLALFALG